MLWITAYVCSGREKAVDGVRSFFAHCDPTPLALFRIAFGFLMVLDIPQERGLQDVDIRFGDPNWCFFPLVDWVKPVSVQYACLLYSIMFIGAVGICLGLKFKFSCSLFLFPYLYFFLLDKSRWNNHSYLFALFTVLLWCSDAGDYLSLDALSRSSKEKESFRGVPKWNYFILKFQIFILYFLAGIKKLDSDWISGYSMRHLSKHRFFIPIKYFVEPNVIEYYMVHVAGLLYDLTVGFMLNFEVSKTLGVFLSVIFHGMNSQIFDIGMFPYVCLASLVLFCHPNQFPCSYFSKWQTIQNTKTQKVPKKIVPVKRTYHHKNLSRPFFKCKKEKFTCGFLILYVGLQCFLPFSHWITLGYNNWTDGLYGYSWDMMVNSWETLHQKITVRNRITFHEKYLDPDVWVTNDRWSSHADMAVQYAKCIERNLKKFNITEIEVYFDIWKSLNGRFQQRIFDPRVDILRAPWSPFEPVKWLLPLVKEYSHYRKSFFESVASNVANWTESSDVIFVADFPSLYLENFLPKELVNISLEIINGEIILEEEGTRENVTLSTLHYNIDLLEGIAAGPKLSHPVASGQFHKVHTVSYPHPSCYMYTYTNSTLQAQLQRDKENDKEQAGLCQQVFEEFSDFVWEKIELFSRSVYLVTNAYLNLVFDVPMIIRKSVP